MKVCGIICEYNPLHNGHRYHMEQTRRLLGDDMALVCVMSGNFVQRGEPALLPKHVRTEMALRAGADLVIELPTVFAMSGAERFAEAGVALLDLLGVVTHLSFGAEDADLPALRELAETALEHDVVQATLRELQTGISYAAARERALFARLREKAALLQKPNNTLAVEYCKALLRRGSTIEPVAVARRGAAHDAISAEGNPSASELRALHAEGKLDAACGRMPDDAARLMREAAQCGQTPDPVRVACSVMTRLRCMTADELALLPDVSEGLEYRLYDALRASRTPEEALARAKTRRYPLARLRRMSMYAWLGIRACDVPREAPYARVLGYSERGRPLLRAAAKAEKIPLITRPAQAKTLPPQGAALFALEARCTDLYHLTLCDWQACEPGAEWLHGALAFENGEIAAHGKKIRQALDIAANGVIY